MAVDYNMRQSYTAWILSGSYLKENDGIAVQQVSEITHSFYQYPLTDL